MPRVLTAAHSAINWDDPLAEGLLAHVTYPSGGRPVDLVGIGQVKYTGSLASVGGLSPYGTAGDHPQTTTGQGWSISNICNRPATAAAGSVLYIRRRYGALADSGFGCTSASTTSFGGHLVWNDGNLYWDFGGNAGSNRLSATSLDLTVDSVLIMTAGPSGSYIYQNGKLLASSATAITRSLSTSDFGLTYGNSITNTSSRVDTLTIVAERQWTPQEVRLLSIDPFRLVEPARGRRTITILYPGTAGSVNPSGTAAVTLADFTSSATGTETLTGSAAITLAAFTSSASGTVSFTGTSTNTLAAFTGSATGTVAQSVTGTAAITLQDFTSSATGTAPLTQDTVSHDVRTGQPDPRWRDRRRATWPPPLKTRGNNYGRY